MTWITILDTPPGVTPPATVAQWDDDVASASCGGENFQPRDDNRATLIESPLWYAAKWGGFVDQNKNDIPDLQSEWDADDDGVPDTYFYVVNPLKLEQQLNRTFSDILSRGVSHVAPVVSVDEANRTQSGDRLYMAFLQAHARQLLAGQLEEVRFRLQSEGRLRQNRSQSGRWWINSPTTAPLLKRPATATAPSSPAATLFGLRKTTAVLWTGAA